MVTAYLLENYGVHINDWRTALIVAIVMGLLNIFIKPIIVILTLPISILTLGLFLFLINAAMIYLTAEFVGGFQVDGLFPALLFSLIYSVVMSFLNFIAGDKK